MFYRNRDDPVKKDSRPLFFSLSFVQVGWVDRRAIGRRERLEIATSRGMGSLAFTAFVAEMRIDLFGMRKARVSLASQLPIQ